MEGVVNVVHLHPLALSVHLAVDAVREQRADDAAAEAEAEAAAGSCQDGVVLHGVDEEVVQSALVHRGGAQRGRDPRHQTAQAACRDHRGGLDGRVCGDRGVCDCRVCGD